MKDDLFWISSFVLIGLEWVYKKHNTCFIAFKSSFFCVCVCVQLLLSGIYYLKDTLCQTRDVFTSKRGASGTILALEADSCLTRCSALWDDKLGFKKKPRMRMNMTDMI